ncbi:AsmA family protein [Parachitinimonas caeni]|uniref:AsmA family protein n=1 Tax=Parachitinimonas caeni TaxID=3031301 RepID=A0ABT7DUM3_9NEIS|nr:hypothetical protein [Parachitinimonas caeni]MDK2123771.1 hypothetical protein [Parachitinimonas caeni]
MSSLKKMLVVLVIVVVLLGLAPLVFPYNRYIAGLEKTASERLGSPVKISSIDFTYSPRPALLIEGITIGKVGEASINKIEIPINGRNILRIRNHIADMTLDGGQFDKPFLIALPAKLKPSQEGDIRLDTIGLRNCSVKLGPSTTVGPLQGKLKLAEDGMFKEVTVSDEKERANLTIKPLNDKFSLEFHAKTWTTPGRFQVYFDQLLVKGIADQTGVTIDDINGMLFNAVVLGSGRLDWSTENWNLSGSLTGKGIAVEPFSMMFSPITHAKGRMEGTAQFLYEGTSFEDLLNTPQIDMKFTVTDGILHNLDLITPLKSQSPTTLARGGQTRFDSLSGDIKVRGQEVAMSGLALNSGKFTANGTFNVSADKKLSGRIGARLRSGPISVDASLGVSGKLDAPELNSGGASRPGANAATSLVY